MATNKFQVVLLDWGSFFVLQRWPAFKEVTKSKVEPCRLCEFDAGTRVLLLSESAVNGCSFAAEVSFSKLKLNHLTKYDSVMHFANSPAVLARYINGRERHTY